MKKRNQQWDKTRLRVLAAIPIHKKNARIADRIHEIAGTPSEWRTQVHTREFIRSLRLDGQPICSSTACGYWVTDSADELMTCIKSIEHRATEIMELTAVMRITQRFMEGENDAH
jgi:hypothetical protein